MNLNKIIITFLLAVKELVDNKINLFMQKEQLTLLDDNGEPTLFAPIMIATLSTCAQLERDSISFRQEVIMTEN